MTSAYELVAKFEQKISRGEWAPGQRLPAERALSAQFGAARNTIRHALSLLAEKRKITREAGRATFVSETPPDQDPTKNALISSFKMGSPSDVMEVRLIVEPTMAALAAARATKEQMEAIERAYVSCTRADSVGDYEHWDAQFHLAVFKAARNPLLISMCEAINEAREVPEWRKLKERTATPDRRAIFDVHHLEVFQAIQNRDAQLAREKLYAHLSIVRDNFLAA